MKMLPLAVRDPCVALISSLTFLLTGCVHAESEPSPAQSWENLQRDYPQSFLYRGASSDKVAALTFDDGPSELSVEILDLLARHEVKATFFWQGNNLAQHQAVVRRAIAEGHTVGQHSWDHPHVARIAPGRLLRTQILPTNRAFVELFGHKPRFYRPPFGETNVEQLDAISRNGLQTVGWSITSLDWDDERNSTKEVADRVLLELHPGAIILLHDYQRPDQGRAILEAIEEIIVSGKKEGFRWVNLTELHDLRKDT